MISLDTNVLARFYVQPKQEIDRREQDRASALLASENEFYVPITVAQELYWVLSSIYGCDASTVRDVFDHLAALPNIALEDRDALLQAAEWHVKGMAFPDALHLAKSAHCQALASFDDRFAKRARKLGLVPPVSVPAD